MKSKYKFLIALSLFIILIPILYLISTGPTDDVNLSAIAVLRSRTGKSIFGETNVTMDNVEDFLPLEENLGLAEESLNKMGFEVTAKAFICMVIRSPKSNFEDKLNTNIIEKSLPDLTDNNQSAIRYYDFDQEVTVPEELSEYIEEIFMDKPGRLQSLDLLEPSANPPELDYYAITVDEFAELLGATRCHAEGITGEGVKVVIIDTGFYGDHPYFQDKNYKVKVKATNDEEYDPKEDLDGHGTGIAANLLAIAPKVDLTMVKCQGNPLDDNGETQQDYERPDVLRGLIAALEEEPDIISSSVAFWEPYLDAVFPETKERIVYEVLINLAEKKGTTFFWSAGNLGTLDWPASYPKVVSVGGVYPEIIYGVRYEASNYASSGFSAVYGNRVMPDVCGFVGKKKYGILIKLPVQPYSRLDQNMAGWGEYKHSPGPNDRTRTYDGWAVFSGTSSATPQVAGVAALLVQRNIESTNPKSGLELARWVKNAIIDTARDVTLGKSANDYSAAPGFDLATGWGLVNAAEASRYPLLYVTAVPENAAVDESVLIEGGITAPLPMDYGDVSENFVFIITEPSGRSERITILDSNLDGEVSFKYPLEEVGEYVVIVEKRYSIGDTSVPGPQPVRRLTSKAYWTAWEEPYT